MLTIGQLAKRVGMRTSTLRFYEAEGLLLPNGRSESGYRQYTETAVSTL
ncbi:MAG: MerR family DNA-binding transcriptional regulator, partial [Anaerolineales bacterium]|nr:MerR family DNA-binding transcriptional regulator [Anaerolineales bacterium]